MSHSFFTTGIINAISTAGTPEPRTLFFSLSAPVPRGRQHRSLSHALHLQPCRVLLPPFLWKVGASAWQAWTEVFPASFRQLNARCALRAVRSPDRISLAGPTSVRKDSILSVGRGGIIASGVLGRVGWESDRSLSCRPRYDSARLRQSRLASVVLFSCPCLSKDRRGSALSVVCRLENCIHVVSLSRAAVSACCLFDRRFEYTRVSVLSGCLLRNEHAGGRVV